MQLGEPGRTQGLEQLGLDAGKVCAGGTGKSYGRGLVLEAEREVRGIGVEGARSAVLEALLGWR